MRITFRSCLVTNKVQYIKRNPYTDPWFPNLLKRNFILSHGVMPQYKEHMRRWMLGEIKQLKIGDK